MAVPLELEQVSKQFSSRVRALDGASLRLERGQRACLLGPNGAGKTTLIRVVMGVLRPTAGRVSLFGARHDDDAYLAARRRVGIVPQSPGMYRDLRAGEFLEVVARLYERGSVDATVARFGLASVRDRAMGELSGGWQRRLVLAAALLPDPELLLLDEPTVGLDPVATREVHAILREQMEGRTTLLCTHNLAEAEALCSDVVILQAGRVRVHEPLAALRAQAGLRLRIAARQPPAEVAALLRARGYAVVREDEATWVAVDDPVTEGAALLRALLGAGIDAYECRVETPRLEDLFVGALAS